MKRGNRAALELSIGTIVIIVIAMTMLILGIILVKNIFSGAQYNVLNINNKIRDEIGKLFVEGKKTVIYLPNSLAEIKVNDDWGVAFAIKNVGQSTTGSENQFHYEVKLSDNQAEQKCKISEAAINDWIQTGKEDTVMISPGGTYYGIARIYISEGTELCTVRFHLDVEKDGQAYYTDFFDVKVV